MSTRFTVLTEHRLEEIHEQQFTVFPEVERLQNLYHSSKYDQEVLSSLLSAQQKAMSLVEEALTISRHLRNHSP
jgi:hypothetical protein